MPRNFRYYLGKVWQEIGKLKASQGGDNWVGGHQPLEDLGMDVVSPKAPRKVGQHVVYGDIHHNRQIVVWTYQGSPGTSAERVELSQIIVVVIS